MLNPSILIVRRCLKSFQSLFEFSDINIVSEMLSELQVETRDFVSTACPASGVPPLLLLQFIG